MKPQDLIGNEIKLGVTVVRAVKRGNSPMLDVCKVTKIENGKIYLDNSPSAIIFTDRLCVISK